MRIRNLTRYHNESVNCLHSSSRKKQVDQLNQCNWKPNDRNNKWRRNMIRFRQYCKTNGYGLEYCRVLKPKNSTLELWALVHTYMYETLTKKYQKLMFSVMFSKIHFLKSFDYTKNCCLMVLKNTHGGRSAFWNGKFYYWITFIYT